MAIGRTRVTIDGTDAVFHIKTFPARQAATKLAALQRMFAGPLAKMDVGGAFDGVGKEAAIAKAIGEISLSLDEVMMAKLDALLIDPHYISVEMDGEPAAELDVTKFDLAIPDVAVLFELYVQVIKVNFASAFMRGFGRIGRALQSQGINLSERFRMKSLTS